VSEPPFPERIQNDGRQRDLAPAAGSLKLPDTNPTVSALAYAKHASLKVYISPGEPAARWHATR
jgi:hypothetical protein